MKRVSIILAKDTQVPSHDSEGNIIEGEFETIKAGDRVMRTTTEYAKMLVDTGSWRYTSKGKLKSFINKQRKLNNNMRTIEMAMNMTGQNFNEQRFNNKVIVEVPTFRVDADPSYVKHITNKPIFNIITHNYIVKANNGVFPKQRKQVEMSVKKTVTTDEYGTKKIICKPVMKVVTERVSPWFKEKRKYIGTGHKMLVVAY